MPVACTTLCGTTSISACRGPLPPCSTRASRPRPRPRPRAAPGGGNATRAALAGAAPAAGGGYAARARARQRRPPRGTSHGSARSRSPRALRQDRGALGDRRDAAARLDRARDSGEGGREAATCEGRRVPRERRPPRAAKKGAPRRGRRRRRARATRRARAARCARARAPTAGSPRWRFGGYFRGAARGRRPRAWIVAGAPGGCAARRGGAAMPAHARQERGHVDGAPAAGGERADRVNVVLGVLRLTGSPPTAS